jgi:hypothetical protein
MMRAIRRNRLSVVLGLGTAALFLLTTSQLAPLTPEKISRVQYYARPQDMVQIREGTPFLVPNGKLFVLTALGGREGNLAQLRMNGEGLLWHGGGGSSGVQALPNIRPFVAGSSLEVVCNDIPGDGRAWGYLDESVPPPANVVRLPYTPHPSQMVEIREGEPLTVPAGKLFVLTVMGRPTGGGSWSRFDVDGEFATIAYNLIGAPVGMSVSSGHVVEPIAIWPAGKNGKAWGYLADAR